MRFVFHSRPVGWQLGTGIAAMPLVFGWFLLRPGYQSGARAMAFGWMFMFTVLTFLALAPPGGTPASAHTALTHSAQLAQR